MTNSRSPLKTNSPARGLRLRAKAAFVGSMRPGLDDRRGPPRSLTTVVRVVLRPVVVLNLLDGDDVGRPQVIDDDLGQPPELLVVVAGVEVLDVEGRDGELVAP